MTKKTKSKTDTPAVMCQHSEMMDIAELKPHPQNPNKHSDEQVALLAKNIRHLGWRHPIIVSKRTGFIVAGHARLQAAQVLNLAMVPVDLQDFASETEERAYLIADNRIAELAEIQAAQIKDLLQELDTGEIDMDLTGYTVQAIEELMTQFYDPAFSPGTEDEQGRLDQLEPKIVCCPKCGERFDAREQM
jgi:ParB-like chromosome segregation protein Spo0J